MIQKDMRIEQLVQEKEHLDWDRKMVQKLIQESVTSRTIGPPPSRPANQPKANSASGSTGASCAELEGISMTSTDVPPAQAADAPPITTTRPAVRLVADLNWQETTELTRLKRPAVPSESGKSSMR